MEIRERIARNLNAIQDRMAASAARSGRPAAAVRLIPVTKTVGIPEARILIDLGLADLAENRLEASRGKIEAIGNAVCWHMAGHVQRRKARDIDALFDTVDSVDSIRLAETLEKRCAEQDRRLAVLLEINVSGEEQKYGFTPDQVGEALEKTAAMDRIDVRGLMTMAPFGAEESVLRRVFSGLRELAQKNGLPELSMGMTDDFEIAIEEGATQVRIGRALFAE
jgi:PLP dependent protein